MVRSHGTVDDNWGDFGCLEHATHWGSDSRPRGCLLERMVYIVRSHVTAGSSWERLP